MAAIGARVTDSTTDRGEDEITSLFIYLIHLADPASLEKSARWVTCQDDYKTFARARQADWHEVQLYGHGKNKLDRNRFAGEASATGGPLDTLDAEEVRKRHLTMASRHQKKAKAEGRPRPAAKTAAVETRQPTSAPIQPPVNRRDTADVSPF